MQPLLGTIVSGPVNVCTALSCVLVLSALAALAICISNHPHTALGGCMLSAALRVVKLFAVALCNFTSAISGWRKYGPGYQKKVQPTQKPNILSPCVREVPHLPPTEPTQLAYTTPSRTQPLT